MTARRGDERAVVPGCGTLVALKAMCLDNLLHLGDERIYLKDGQSRFLFVSEGWIDAYASGLAMAEIVGKTDADFFGKEHARTALADEKRIMRTGKPMITSIEREEYKDRPFAWVETTKLPLRDDHGRIVGTFGISRDQTERLTAERALARQAQQLQIQNERLRELDHLKDEFIAAVSHELRTPLASIIGYVELLEDEDASGPDAGHFLEVIGRNAYRLSRLIGDLLFLSGIQSGTMTMEFRLTDLGEVAASAVDEMRHEAERKQITLSLSAVPLPCVADPDRICQLLTNLISNAVKFTPRGGSVWVKTGTEGELAVLTVADTGNGIPEADLKSIFDRFFRSRAAARQAIPGTGLGLTISKAIADAHGGSVTVESAEGQGSVFRAYLPLGKPRPRGASPHG